MEEFALGFGPTLAGKEVGGNQVFAKGFSLGRFCAPGGYGGNGLEGKEGPSADDQGSFQNKSLPWRLATIAAGPPYEFCAGDCAVYTIFFMFITLPPRISHVEPASPAEIAGLLPGDEFVSVNGQAVDDTERIIELIKMSPGQQMSIGIKRQDKFTTLFVTPPKTIRGRAESESPLSLLNPATPFWRAQKLRSAAPGLLPLS